MEDFLAELNEYHPVDAQEIMVKEVMLDLLIQKSQEAISRTNIERHFTASAWILNANKTAVLLIKHTKLKKWLQPGGHADGQTNLHKVSLKEAEEETGLQDLKPLKKEIFDIDIHLIPARKNEPEHYHYDIRYAFTTPSSSIVTINKESTEYTWVNLKEIGNFTSNNSILRMAVKSVKFQG